MKRSRTVLAIALVALCTSALAQHEHGDKKPAMDPAMMDAMMKAGTPGTAHQQLEPFVGTWTTQVTSWMVPGADPMKMEGTSETKWVMGGRYLEQRFSGNFMGMPFEGVGYTGYDNVKKHYWSTWMDNMSTGFFISTGTAAGKTWSFSGSMPDPMTGKDMRADSKITITDADHHTMEMWAPGPDGKMFKSMEMLYSRKK